MSPLLDRRQRHVTATGLFLLISLALMSVGMRMGSLASEPAGLRDPLELSSGDFKAPPYFTLTDRDGEVLAWSVETYAVEASPFHLWLRHTPEWIVGGLADALGLEGPDRERLGRDLLCLDDERRVRVERWPLVRAEAEAVARWIDRGGPGERGPLAGIQVERIADWVDPATIAALDAAGRGDEVRPIDRRRAALLERHAGPFYELVWRPQVLLSADTREFALPELARGRGQAARWVRALSSDLFELLAGPRERERAMLRAEWERDPRPFRERPVPRGYELAAERVRRDGFLASVRDLVVGPRAVPAPDEWVFVGPPREWVFDGLVPRRYVELVDELDVARLDRVRAFVAEEELSDYELRLEPTSRRVYPAGELGVLGAWEWWPAPDAALGDAPVLRPTRGLEQLGYAALRRVERRHGDPRVPGSATHDEHPAAERAGPAGTEEERAPGGPEEATAVRGAVGDPGSAPRGGADSAPHLVAGTADRLERRLMRPRRPGEPREYYLERGEGLGPATVESTLDLELQARLDTELAALLDTHQAALAMGVVIDLASREVRALGWEAAHASMAFPPLQHGFTPGSTFKLVTAALALELGVVRPDTVFDVGHGAYQVREVRPDGSVRTRTVREADGFATGRITAAECVAHSSNAGMVQIGLRVPVEAWKRMTADLGYGRPACPDLLAAGLSNRAGRVGEDDRRGGDPWGMRRSHTSVSFGDSVTTTLLQHAQALAALVDDGNLRPLRFVRAWEVDGARHEFPEEPGRRVVSEQVSAQLRAMMRLGATVGTGEGLARPEGLALHTKTGTTEKLSFDVCSHKYWRDYAACLERGEPWDDAERRRRYRGDFSPRSRCYVSSILAVAPSPVDGRPLLVLIVVDDPHGEEKFGSKVAGPTAVEVLTAGLGIEPAVESAPAAPVPFRRTPELPWDRYEVAAERRAEAGR